MSPLRIPQPGGGNAPSIAHLLDHTADVWRFPEILGVARQVVRIPEIVYPALACAVNRKASKLETLQGALVPMGIRSVYFDIGITLEERDVISLTAGPEAPAQLEVESKAYPRGHHVEATVSEFHGKLPTPEGS